MTFDWMGWLGWVTAGLCASLQTSCDLEIWLIAFAVAMLAVVCVNDLWIGSEHSDESKL